MNETLPIIAILGGTGELGTGLALRWIQAGYKVIIGSRTEAKAADAADTLMCFMNERGNSQVQVEAMDNQSAARAADIVTLTVPFSHQKSVLELIKPVIHNKILIDVTVPLVPPKVARVQMPAEGSAGQIAQNILGEDIYVVSAFQNVPAVHLQSVDELDCDVLVCGDSKDARSQVIEIIQAAGMRAFHAGSIANAAAVEAMTSVLIFINKKYKCHAGIRITGTGEQ